MSPPMQSVRSKYPYIVSRSSQSVFVIGLIMLTYVSVWAAPTPRMFVVPSLNDGQRDSTQVSKRFTGTLIDQLKKSKRLVLEDGKVKRRGVQDELLMKAETLKVSSINLYLKGKHEEALEGFISSLKGFQKNLVAIRDMKSVFQTLYYAGAACMALGYTADTKFYFNQLAAISPEGDFEVKVSQKVRKKYTKYRKRLLKKKRGSVAIETIPAGVQVWVDGQERCTSPCEVTDLARGQHYIWSKKPGVGKAGRLIKIKGGKRAELKLNLTPAPQAKPANPVSPELAIALTDQLKEGRLDGVLKERLDRLADEQQVDYTLLTYIGTLKRKIYLFAFLYNVNSKEIVPLKTKKVRANFTATRVAAISTARKINALLKEFPTQGSGEVYQPLIDFKEAVASQSSVASAPPKETPVSPVVTPTAPKTPNSRPTNPQASVVKEPLIPATPKDFQTPPANSSTHNLLPPPVTTPSSKRDSKITSSPWFWTGVGAVVLSGAAISTYLILDSSSDPSQQRFQSLVVW